MFAFPYGKAIQKTYANISIYKMFALPCGKANKTNLPIVVLQNTHLFAQPRG